MLKSLNKRQKNSRFESWLSGACEKDASDLDLGLDSVFRRVLSTTNYNWIVKIKPQYDRKSDEKQNFEF